jgi:peptidoglycan hydrolase-like protein with peptidoglycan-binding domain
MGVGFFTVSVQAVRDALPIAGARVGIFTQGGNALYNTYTDRNGRTGDFTLFAPDVQIVTNNNFKGVVYERYDVRVSKNGFTNKLIRGVEIVDGQRTVLPVEMHPAVAGSSSFGEAEATEEEIDIPPIGLLLPTSQRQESFSSGFLKDVYIPEYLTVHLGVPDNAAARNVLVRFEDYIKNVASSEIYPTWPINAILSNIHCQVTFALNRVYTEWYRSRGYNFDITNSTAYDQYYVDGRNVFDSISNTVDRVFNVYARRVGFQNPYFTQYCNGTTSVCSGLSQWGSVSLATQGVEPIEILQYYYKDDLELVASNNISSISESYPGTALSIGDTGDSVALMQNYLRRIRINYPLIPRIEDPDGLFGPTTELAVRAFQSTFEMITDGIIGRATWYKISYIYVGVIKLGELDGEGERVGIGTNPPSSVLRLGDSGRDVIELQFILDSIEAFYPDIPSVIKDGYFGYEVQNAVVQFQKSFGLVADGIVGPEVWNKLYSVYKGIFNGGTVAIPPNAGENFGPEYPGVALKLGDEGANVRLIQQYLSAIRIVYNSILPVVVNGEFDRATSDSVKSFQNEFVLVPDGVVGRLTWNELTRIYGIVKGRQPQIFEYPGYPLVIGTRGDAVITMQLIFNELHGYYPSIPQVVVDGIFGPNFYNAVVAFQTLFGLAPDGIIGPLTWNRAVYERSRAANRANDY